MASAQKDETTKSGEKNEPNPVADTIKFVSLVARLTLRLNEHPTLKEYELGVSEWSFMHALLDSPELQSGQIAHTLGISPQRGAQIVGSLVKLGYITAVTSQIDTRKKELAVTPTGKKCIGAIDQKISAIVAKAYGERPGVSTNLVRNVRALLSAVNEDVKK